MLKNRETKSQLKIELTKLKENYDDLAKSHLDLQRTVKRVLLSNKFVCIYYSYDIVRFYTNHELDNMVIVLHDNEQDEKIELRIKT